MDNHTHSAHVHRLEVVETGRRRRWSDEEKLRIVAESAAGPRLDSETARRYGISPSQLFGWRRDFGMVGAGNAAPDPAFLPIAVGPSAQAAARSSTNSARIEIELPNGRFVRVDALVETEALARILDVVDRRR